MKEEAKLANVKLQVIRDDFGHYPTIKHVFEMLDSTCVNPIPPKIVNYYQFLIRIGENL